MKIRFINHASAIIDCGDVKILTDPWYCGSPFNNGWSLLVESDIDINSLDFNYLWYSHEHPDHFSIEDLKKINEKKKKEITILFQKTADQKVKYFCQKLGFEVLELEPLQFYHLKGKVQITCGIEGGFDSWLSVSYKNKTLLNINDCRLETKEDLSPVKKLLGDIDVLMTQFSWANWVGNKGDNRAVEISRNTVHAKNDAQIKILDPKFVIPFASFAWFSHEENCFCNNDAITVEEFSNRYSNRKVITMYLGDEWKVGEETDCSEAVLKWMEADPKNRSPNHSIKSVSREALEESFKFMKTKLKEKNDWSSILELKNSGHLEECTIRLNDLGISFLFDFTKEKLIETSDQSDIEMGSESFDYLMRNPWGRGTLMINGRFKANYKYLYKFLRQTHIYYGNNIGKTFPKDIKKEEIINPKCFVFETIKESKK